MEKIIKIHESDNVAVAISTISKNEAFCAGSQELTAREEIPAGHKIALLNIEKGTPVTKYGFPIGYATQLIPKGSWIHTHNMKTSLANLLSYTYRPDINSFYSKSSKSGTSFEGFVRDDGKAGVRNEIWIIPTVGCVNSIASALANRSSSLIKGTVD